MDSSGNPAVYGVSGLFRFPLHLPYIYDGARQILYTATLVESSSVLYLLVSTYEAKLLIKVNVNSFLTRNHKGNLV